jgi:hypothetical protein
MRVRKLPAFGGVLTWLLVAPADADSLALMFEQNTDAGAGDELAFVSFSTLDDAIANTGGTTEFSQINVNPAFSTTGITWDGSAYRLMFEQNTDAGAGDELAFVSFSTWDDLIANTGGTSVFSQINVNPAFSTTGITWDGSAYRLMFEQNTDAGAGDELAFVSFSTWDDLIANTGGTSVFSQINVNSAFSTTGLITLPEAAPPIPEPGAIALFAAGLALVASRVRRRFGG